MAARTIRRIRFAAIIGTTLAIAAAGLVFWLGRDAGRDGPAESVAPETTVRTIEVRPVGPAAATPPVSPTASPPGPAAATVPASTAAGVPEQATKPFSMLGLTWADPAAQLNGVVQVRTRDAARRVWSRWQLLDTDAHLGPEPGTAEAHDGVRGSTEPLWVGPSDGVEVRVLTATGNTTGLPAGLRLDLVDPGGSDGSDGSDGSGGPRGSGSGGPRGSGPGGRVGAAAGTRTAQPFTAGPDAQTPASPAPSPEPAAQASAVPDIPVPRVVSRAGWRAQESLNRADPVYGDTVRAVFVHHTAGSNTYRCADSPAIIRSIHAFHVRSRGWNDIGYNFLVNKCGTLYEGRGGGVRWPVIGAHTYGFNTNTAGIAVLGTYGDKQIGPTVRQAIAQIAAYKLGRYGNDPTGRVTLVAGVDGKFRKGQEVTFNRVSGHRDAVGTECPGNALYQQLPLLRRLAAGPVTGLRVTRLSGGIGWAGGYHARETATVSWRLDTPTALLRWFEIVVDGTRVATAPAGARSATLTLSQGRRLIQVRAVHLSGRSSVTPGRAVIVDRTPPMFTRGPSLALRTGTVQPTAVPATLGWLVHDARGLRSVELSTPARAAFTATTTRWSTTATPGGPTRWAVRAVDPAGNSRTGSVTASAGLLTETAATRTGTWRRYSSDGFLGGAALGSNAPDASLSWTVTGTAAALVTSRAPNSGQVRVHVDGVLSSTVDLRSTSAAHRQAVWTAYWPAGGEHTVRVTVVGTDGRPFVALDGIAYLR